MKRPLSFLIAAVLIFSAVHAVYAQQKNSPSTIPVTVQESLTEEATSQAQVADPPKEDLTKPEETKQKEEILSLFEKRLVEKPNFVNFMAFTVQHAVRVGVPANTIILILLLPFLATAVAFVRYIIGLPSLEMLVPVALAVTLVATGLTAGFIILLTILLASLVSKLILKRVHILQIPKKALSIMVVSVFVFLALMGSAMANLLIVKQLSIFPILIFILLSDKIVSLQLKKNFSETIVITAVTIALGISGYFVLALPNLRGIILLYPELVLTLIPINLLIGRYLGLRLTEYFRFNIVRQNAD